MYIGNKIGIPESTFGVNRRNNNSNKEDGILHEIAKHRKKMQGA
jgi:hypothetical protein